MKQENIPFEKELIEYLHSCKKKPTPAGIWSAAIRFISTHSSCDGCAYDVDGNGWRSYNPYCNDCMRLKPDNFTLDIK